MEAVRIGLGLELGLRLGLGLGMLEGTVEAVAIEANVGFHFVVMERNHIPTYHRSGDYWSECGGFECVPGLEGVPATSRQSQGDYKESPQSGK